jgi:hypothetical protein
VPEPAHADHDGDGPGVQAVPDGLDRVQRRERRVGERRGGDGIQVAEGDEVAGGHDEVLRHGARKAQAGPGTWPRGNASHAFSAPRAHARQRPQPQHR